MIKSKRNSRGFNLVEMLVSSAILSGTVLTVGAISTRALTGTRLNRQYEIAASLIDKQLSLIDYIGIDQFVEQGQFEGVVAEFEPGYQWQASAEYQGTDNLYLVTITVTWVDRNRPYSLAVQTMLNGKSTYAETATGQEVTQ
jgi:prepilin-type N-terminal cleavage/methylation domain-containing protein